MGCVSDKVCDSRQPSPAAGSKQQRRNSRSASKVSPDFDPETTVPEKSPTPNNRRAIVPARTLSSEKPTEIEKIRRTERTEYTKYRDGLINHSYHEGYVVDAEWIDSWLKFVISNGQRPPSDINQHLFKDRLTSLQITINTERGMCLIEQPLWNYLRNMYGSRLALRKTKGRGFTATYSEDGYKEGRIQTIINIKELTPAKVDYVGSAEEGNVAQEIIKKAETVVSRMKTKSGMPAYNGADAVVHDEDVPVVDDYAVQHAAPVGMRNYGTNCYVNAGLQCLLCIPELNGYFLSEKYENISYSTKRTKRSVCREYARLCKEIFSGKYDVVAPAAFIGMCSYGQQDAHEFFTKKLFSLIQDETDPATKAKRKDGWNSDESWRWYRKYNTNIFDRLLGGQLKSSVACKSCGHVSVIFDPFLGLSLALSGSSLDGCLDDEFEAKELSKSAGYTCQQCKKVSAAVKKTEIDKAPKYLLLHLKRLVEGARKINKHIKYQEKLSIKRYCVSGVGETTYELIAVCIHSGGPRGGHYYSVGKRDGTWYLFNDDLVEKVAEHEVMNCEAYMLFYCRTSR